jgi:hypothetical protein
MDSMNMLAAPGAAAETCIQADDREGIPFDFIASAEGIFELPEDEQNDPTWLCSLLAVRAHFHSVSGDG